ncbi:hypothetical protein ABPG72_001384 [Tetrahymena utriculariae]
MSNMQYNMKWQEAINDLMEQVTLEYLPLEQNEQQLGMKYKRDSSEWFHFWATLYIKYIDIYKKLEDCYDQLVHPQKRVLLKEMLENVIVRLCETKSQVVKYNTQYDATYKSDYPNLDELVMDLKLTPDCLDIPIPRYFREEDKKRLDERNQILDALLLEYTDTNEPQEEQYEDSNTLQADMDTAIRIIQRYERGRQGIERANLAKILKKEEEKKLERQKKLAEGTEIGEETEKDDAALVIKKYWRGYKSRRIVQDIREEELLFLGMKKLVEDPTLPESQHKQAQNKRQKMKYIQEEHEQEFNDEIENLKRLVKSNEGPDILDKMRAERREWIMRELEKNEFKDAPQDPSEFYNQQVMDPEQQAAEAAKAAEEAKKKGGAKKDDKKKKGKPSELDEFLENNKPTGPSPIVLKLQEQIEKHSGEWSKRDETNNFEQKHETELAKMLIKPVVEEQIKQQVDEMIAEELDIVRLRYDIKKKKQKKPPRPRNKGKNKKKFPGDSSNKGRDPKDILAGLVEKRVAKKLIPASLMDLKGEQNVLGKIQEIQADENLKKAETLADPKIKKAQLEEPSTKMPDPSIAQIRQIIAEYIAFPLGSKYAKEKLDKMNYFFFMGPRGSGKTLAVRALAHECNAIILDISPSNVDGQYTDKKQIDGMINSAFKVAKEFQPAIIYCEDFEYIFGQAKKKKSQVNPLFAKMKKPLMDFKKGKFFEPEDRVVFIGCTNRPWDCSQKEIKSFFDKKIYFPFPNYGTRMLLFKTFLEQKKVPVPDNFPINTIAHISEGWSAGSFKMAIERVFTERRLQKINEEQIKLSEFIGPLSNVPFTSKEEFKEFKKFNQVVTGLQANYEAKKAPADDQKGDKNKKKK